METVFNSVPVGLYRTTLTGGRFIQANAHLAELLLYPSVDALMKASTTDMYVDPAERTRLVSSLDRDGARSVIETQLRRFDGSTTWVRITACRTDAGTEPSLTGAVTDITTRRQLEATAQRFARAAEASGEVIFMTDIDERFTYVNPEFTRVYGYTSEELIGLKTPRVLKSGADASAEYEALWSALRTGRTVRRELTNRRKDGTTVLIDTCANAVVDRGGALTGFLAIQRDITAKRHTEQALYESLALSRRMFDESPVGVAVLSMDGRFTRANAMLCEMLGWCEEELKDRAFVDVIHPEEHDKSLTALEDLRSGRIDQIRIEERYVRKDGKEVWGDMSVRAVTNTNGDPLYMMPVVIDITHRRGLEQQLRQAQKMEAIGQLAGGIAHDFNNILTTMLGYSELLLDDLGKDPAAVATVRQIQEGGQRAAALTRQLLAFSRTQVLRVEVADLNVILDRFHHLVRPIIGEDIDLAFDLAAEPVLVRCDVAQFEQVAMNLIVNARDAMPDGGSICVRTATVNIDEGRITAPDDVMHPGRYAQLVVQDTGCGMDEETRRRVFEPFFTTKAPGKGTGLGLAVVYGIVKQLGGFIWVYSEPGRGTTFRVYFPCAEGTRAPESISPIEKTTRAGNERILLVEDDAEVRAFAALILEKHGYHVTEARTGADALERLKSGERPDLVITDMVMPGIDGADLARRIDEDYPNLRVLFTSGYMNHRLVSRLDGAFDLLEKPFTATTLLNRVRQSMDGARMKR